MGYMKKYKCPICFSTKFVIRKTKRNKSLLFFCKNCKKYFSVNTYWLNKREILRDHLDGLSFRAIAQKYNISHMKAWRICFDELRKLPNNNQFTFRYCSKFSGIFVVDGKYFNISSERYDWVLLWGVDYKRHDIPIISISPSESYQSWSKYFLYFRILNHYPSLIVCDDNINLKTAAYHLFPKVRIQTCYNHFKENIRRNLQVRSNGKYQPFVKRIEKILNSSNKLSDQVFNRWLSSLYDEYKDDILALSVLTNIERNKKELLGYRGISQAPLTTNLIEGLNGHLQARLQKLRSFQTIEHAKLWLNGYVLKRRLTKFTDCRGKFSFLNGKTGVETTKKEGVDIPPLF
jgi:hypothetical protein